MATALADAQFDVAAFQRSLEQARRGELDLAADSLAKASTPEPFSTSKTSNWIAKLGGLPDYIQHIAHGILRSQKGKKDESKAIEEAIGICKDPPASWGPDARAAAAKAAAEWEALKAKNEAKKNLSQVYAELVALTEPEFDGGDFALRLSAARAEHGLSLAGGEEILFDPAKHPRGVHGHFSKALGRLTEGGEIKLPHGTKVTRNKVGNLIVTNNKGEQHGYWGPGEDNAAGAARQALAAESVAKGQKTRAANKDGIYVADHPLGGGKYRVMQRKDGVQSTLHDNVASREEADKLAKSSDGKEGRGVHKEFPVEIDPADIESHLGKMDKTGKDSVTVKGYEDDGTNDVHVTRHGEDKYHYTPGDGRRREGSKAEVMDELYPSVDDVANDPGFHQVQGALHNLNKDLDQERVDSGDDELDEDTAWEIASNSIERAEGQSGIATTDYDSLGVVTDSGSVVAFVASADGGEFALLKGEEAKQWLQDALDISKSMLSDLKSDETGAKDTYEHQIAVYTKEIAKYK